MSTTKITGKELRDLGFPEEKAIGEALKILEIAYKGKRKSEKL